MRLIPALLGALLITIVLLPLAGCGAPPVTFVEIPVHPNLAPLEPGANTLADTIAASLESSLAERSSVELKLYSVPDDVIWEKLDSFYTESLADSDWKAADDLRQESEALTTTGWKRGSLTSEQGLMVGYAPDMLGDGAFLIVALFSVPNNVPATAWKKEIGARV